MNLDNTKFNGVLHFCLASYILHTPCAGF